MLPIEVRSRPESWGFHKSLAPLRRRGCEAQVSQSVNRPSGAARVICAYPALRRPPCGGTACAGLITIAAPRLGKRRGMIGGEEGGFETRPYGELRKGQG